MYAIGIFVGFLSLAPHGIPEAMGYFIGAIAGGIISVAVSKRITMKGELKTIFKDAAILIAIALILLFIGSWIEASAIARSIG